MNRKISVFALIVLTIALILIPSVHAEYPIENMVIVQDLPDTMIAGSSYEMIITFDNIAEESVPLIVKITVTSEEPIGYGEIFIDEINLNGFDLDYSEFQSGVFTAVEGSVTSSSQDNELSIIVYTAINLMPGTYIFEVDLLGEKVFDFIVEVPADTPTTIDASEEAGVVLEDFTSTEPATVAIILYEENPHPEVEVPPESPMALGIFLEFEASVEEFTTEIRVYYTDEEVEAAGIEEEDLRLYYFDGTDWIQCEETGVETEENYVWARVTHFTVFAPFGAAVEPEPEPEPTQVPGRPNKKPVADAGSNQTVYVDQIIEFSGGNSSDPDGEIVSYVWDFGDGVETSGVNVFHTYLEPGNYTVTLTVRDDRYGDDSDTCTITVRETPPLPPPPPPLPPILDNLTITPAEVERGDNVTIGLDIENIDSQPFTYIVTIQIGELTLLVDVELEAFESKTVSRTITTDAVGAFDVTVDGMTGSFTVEAPEIPLNPAEFVVSALSITPEEAELGEGDIVWMFVVSVDVTNVGEQAGSYTVDFKVDGEVVESGTVTLGRGEETPIVFSVTRGVGSYTVEVDGLTGSFVVNPYIRPLEPAEFVVSDLSATPEVEEGEDVTFSVKVTNIGETEGSYTLEFKVDGETIETETITLAGGDSATVSFDETWDAGTYQVNVEDLTETFIVSPVIPIWMQPGYIYGIIVLVASVGAIAYFLWKGKLRPTISPVST